MQDEIETEEIIKDIFRRGKICFIPRYQFQSNHMDMVRIESPEEISSLPKTSWNIPQPGEGDIREEALSTAWRRMAMVTEEPFWLPVGESCMDVCWTPLVRHLRPSRPHFHSSYWVQQTGCIQAKPDSTSHLHDCQPWNATQNLGKGKWVNAGQTILRVELPFVSKCTCPRCCILWLTKTGYKDER
ncbi:5-formyltetrahydrofolate cyclo-ligase isoform X3 [Saimiri boliviensis]|uniref:5-formyltetrahydrofolate cyclo-ligase isoform X3 n=1 Tax=Saimiri boliviensis TaxID=27679 RepID=UPI003D77BC93